DGAHGLEDGGRGRGDHEGGQGAVIEADLRGELEGGAAQALHGGEEDHFFHADVLEEAAAEGLVGLCIRVSLEKESVEAVVIVGKEAGDVFHWFEFSTDCPVNRGGAAAINRFVQMPINNTK